MDSKNRDNYPSTSPCKCGGEYIQIDLVQDINYPFNPDNLNDLPFCWLCRSCGHSQQHNEVAMIKPKRSITKVDSNFTNDVAALISLAEKKGLSIIKEIPRQLARLESLLAYADLRQQMSSFETYIDNENNIGGDPKWLVITFNKYVQKAFGFSVTHSMTSFESSSIANVRRVVRAICENGINKGLTRKAIRNQMWEAVEMLGLQFKQTQELLK